MEKLLLDNLARNQAFDEALQAGAEIDRLAAGVIGQVMFQPDPTVRKAGLEKLQAGVVGYFERQVQPAARKLGERNARAVIDALPPELRTAGLDDPALRRAVLLDGNLRPAVRVRVVKLLVQDRANTLDNRLAAYWLEPGQRPTEKLQYLKDLHAQQDVAQQAYARAMSDHLAGNGKRPRKPSLDYMARFSQDVKGELREQGRRAGTDAETAHFVAQGHKVLAWVTVNASEACPDCKARQGVQGDLEFWEKTGKPGAGKTLCKAACFCMLVPAETLHYAPDLKQKGLEVPREPKTGTAEDKARLDAGRTAQQKTPPPPQAPAATGPSWLPDAGTRRDRTDALDVKLERELAADLAKRENTITGGSVQRFAKASHEAPGDALLVEREMYAQWRAGDRLVGDTPERWATDAVASHTADGRLVIRGATGKPVGAVAWDVDRWADKSLHVHTAGAVGEDAEREMVRHVLREAVAQKRGLTLHAQQYPAFKRHLTPLAIEQLEGNSGYITPKTIKAAAKALGEPVTTGTYDPDAGTADRAFAGRQLLEARRQMTDDARRKAAAEAAGPALVLTGDAEAPITREHVTHLGLVPDHLLRKVVDKGVKLRTGTLNVGDVAPELRGVQPRGYPVGATWDNVAGAYVPYNKTVITGNSNHGCASVQLHEFGHAIGDVLDGERSADLDRFHRQLWDKLDPYLQQGGPGGSAGKSELLAEGFGATLMNPERAAREYSPGFVDFILALLAP